MSSIVAKRASKGIAERLSSEIGSSEANKALEIELGWANLNEESVQLVRVLIQRLLPLYQHRRAIDTKDHGT